MLLKFKNTSIFIPKNYKGHPDDGTDIALIGIEKEDYQKLESYIDFFEIYKDMNKNDPKDPYFEDVGLN